ncbi:hypothetical protein CSIM01_00777 [Colletotrichum simmondsii]|uniref:Uncharacterized protein n=1 Tax=Colletotrichum simmondsii TaxID=703756 RepID=A0A135S2B4_9PEZI|nr:hypothetical protein CSIM01_00777 [Colletotrichum simmondsii]
MQYHPRAVRLWLVKSLLSSRSSIPFPSLVLSFPTLALWLSRLFLDLSWAISVTFWSSEFIEHPQTKILRVVGSSGGTKPPEAIHRNSASSSALPPTFSFPPSSPVFGLIVVHFIIFRRPSLNIAVHSPGRLLRRGPVGSVAFHTCVQLSTARAAAGQPIEPNPSTLPNPTPPSLEVELPPST